MSQDLQQARYDQLLRRVGGLYGPGSKVTEVLPEVFPMLDVETQLGELLGLTGTKLGHGSAQVAAVAAQFSRSEIFNPAGSGKIMTVTKFVVSTSAADAMRWGLSGAALGTLIATAELRDTRFGVGTLPSGEIRTGNSAGAGPASGRASIPADEAFTFEDQNGIAVLAPGTGLEVGSSTVNLLILTSFFWRERIAESSELNF